MYHAETEEKRIAPDRIKERRIELGYSLRTMASILGVAHTCVYKWESGQRPNISYRTLKELSRVLQCDPSYLCGYSDDGAAKNDTNDKSDEVIMGLLKQLSPAEKSELVQYCIARYPEKFESES